MSSSRSSPIGEDFLLAARGQVLLLISDLQLSLEWAEDRPMNAFRLDDRRLPQPITQKIDPVPCFLRSRLDVAPFIVHGLVELVEFAGDKKGEFRSNCKVLLVPRRLNSRNNLP